MAARALPGRPVSRRVLTLGVPLSAKIRGENGVGNRRKRRKKVALVCAGGGVTGAVYEIGCLRALDELLDRSVLDVDLYVGISGGAFVSSLLAAGISPREMYDEVTSRTHSPFGVPATPIYRLGALEFLKSSLQAPRVLTEAVVRTLTGEGRNWSDLAWSLFEVLPPGLMETSGIQEYLRDLFLSRNRSERFQDLPRDLFIVAVDLDNGQSVAFGADGHRDVPVSRAVQASTALPGLYRPVRINGRDYVDGGVKKTAHIHLAIEAGADLILCVNPVVPIHNDARGGPFNGHLSGRGITYVLDQALRIMLHGRMQYGMERYRREYPKVDILLMEPTRDDLRMFSYHIMRDGVRRIVAEHGYQSVLQHFTTHFAAYRRMLARHGIGLRHPSTLPAHPVPPARTSAVGKALSGSLRDLEDSLAPRPRRAAARSAR
jgi:NTE family protein